jgi:hypothetical protein
LLPRAIDLKIRENPSMILLVALTVDEMAIKKHVFWDEHTGMFVGYVTFSKATDEIATKVIVFMTTALNGSWKIPLGYLYVNGLDH